MIRRRKRDDSAPAPPAPTPPAGVSGEPALGTSPAVPTAEADEPPSAAVLDELLAVFGADEPTTLPRRRVDGTEPEAPVAAAADGDPGPGADAASDPKVEAAGSAGDVPTMSTRAMSADELAAGALAPPSGPPAATPSTTADPGTLVPEATKRSTRRSRREMRKEVKRAAKREARHAKEQAKQERKAAKAARKGGSPTADDIDPGEGIRILPADPSRPSPDAPLGVATPPGDSVSTAAGGRTVTVIAADDLPDPVYLEGDLTASAAGETPTRPRVFIDDRDPATGTMVSLEAATTAARMEPRLRERRAAVRRATSRKRLKWLAVVTMLVGVVVATLAVLGSGWFAIRNVDLQGAVYSRGDALDAIVDDVDGANVLRLDTGAIEQRLEAIPWVEDARVTTQFPHAARIEIRERRPTVTYQGTDAAYRVLDDHGRVLDVVVGGRPSAYTEVMVTDGPNLAAGETAPAGYRAAAMLVQSLPAPLRALVASVGVDREGTDLRMELTNGVQVRFGPAQDLVDKIVRLQVALTNPDPNEAAPTQLIDVSSDDVILR